MPISNLRRAAGLSCAVALVLAAASSAQAAVMKATFTGTLVGGDIVGAFGPPLTLFDDTPFEQVVIFDTNRGIADPDSHGGDGRLGGLMYGVSNPILDSWITVGGHTVHFNADWLGGIERQANEISFVDSEPLTDGPKRRVVQEQVRFSPDAPLALDTPFSRTIDNCNQDCGVFVRGFYDDGFFSDIDYAGAFTTTSVTVERLGAVPEPGTWTLAILGFGLAGAALRGRREAAAARAV